MTQKWYPACIVNVHQPLGWTTNPRTETTMKTTMMSICFKLYRILNREEGQDLIEYALVVALIAFAAVVGMQGVATDINNAFLTIGNKLNNAVA